jgi:hypothetical protein
MLNLLITKSSAINWCGIFPKAVPPNRELWSERGVLLFDREACRMLILMVL